MMAENYGGCISKIRLILPAADVIELDNGIRVCDACGTAVGDRETCPGCGRPLDYRDLTPKE